jgi:plasmid stabilization system protein ParE
MKNGSEIKWTSEAERNLYFIFDYLENTWSEREISNFANKLESALQLISKQPAAFPYYDKKKNIRRCVLSPQTTIYYQELPFDNIIVIITLFNNRQNPDNLNI